MKKIVSLLMVMTMLVALLAGCKSESDTIKVGLIVPKTGPVAQYGIAVENAVKLAFDNANEAGGVDGKQFELVIYDNKADATESISVFNRLKDNDKIVALVGPVISSTSLAVGTLANDAKIPMISPTATNVNVTPDYEYVFRACYTDPYQGTVAARFAAEEVGAQTAAVLYDAGNDYSSGLAEAFVAAFPGTIVAYEGYTEDISDFKSVLTTIKGLSPDVMFVPDYYNKVGLIASQVQEIEMDTVMIGGDGWDDVQKDYASAVEGYYFINHFSEEQESPMIAKFVQDYKDAFDGQTPNALAALGYDAALVMIEAIKNADSTKGEDILAALKASNVDAVTSRIYFDANGDPQKSVAIIKIVDGELTLYKVQD